MVSGRGKLGISVACAALFDEPGSISSWVMVAASDAADKKSRRDQSS